MTEGHPSVEILAALICDDVRKENNGKDIIIGVYSGGILVPAFPAALILCVWLYLRIHGKGDLTLRFKVSDSEGQQLFFSEAHAEVKESEESTSLALPKFPIRLEKNTVLKFEWQLGEGEWKELTEKYIRVSPVSPSVS